MKAEDEILDELKRMERQIELALQEKEEERKAKEFAILREEEERKAKEQALEALRNSVRAMKQNGMHISLISQITGISEDEIETL